MYILKAGETLEESLGLESPPSTFVGDFSSERKGTVGVGGLRIRMRMKKSERECENGI